jgi:hypothetical protein
MKSVAESHVHSTTNVATSTVSRDLYLLLAVIQVISVGSFRAVPMGQPRYGSSQDPEHLQTTATTSNGRWAIISRRLGPQCRAHLTKRISFRKALPVTASQGGSSSRSRASRTARWQDDTMLSSALGNSSCTVTRVAATQKTMIGCHMSEGPLVSRSKILCTDPGRLEFHLDPPFTRIR